MTRKQKRALRRILVSLLLFLICLFLPLKGVWRLAAFLLPYALIGWDVLYKAARSVLRGQMFDEHFLMAVATVGAFFVGDYAEGVAVMLFYQVGELFQSYAVGKSRRSIAALMDIRPDTAHIERDGAIEDADPEEAEIGDVIVVRAGERVPLDGVILEGSTALNTSALTGESLPRDAAAGDEVLSGCVNMSGVIRVRVTKVFAESTVSRILEMVENASEKKARTENLITRFARIYTPAVVLAALLLAVLPPLLFDGVWSEWIYRALTFLVISCPCALVISVPLSFFGGIGGASKKGILVKGSNHLEALAKCRTVVFDKTGTLTEGVFRVTDVQPEGVSAEELLQYAAAAEAQSTHPIAQSLQKACGRPVDPAELSGVREYAGEGVRACWKGQELYAGNLRLMQRLGVAAAEEKQDSGTVVYVAKDKTYIGRIVISDAIKAGAKEAVAALKEAGVTHTVMLTGDRMQTAQRTAQALGIDRVHAQLLPDGKVCAVEEMLAGADGRHTLAFVGDGLNDAPVLSRADIGIAMGALGSDAAIEAADIVLMDDDPGKVAAAIHGARRTMRIVRQNIVFALGVKGLVLLLGALGFANMWLAVFADVGVAVIAILNAMRALK